MTVARRPLFFCVAEKSTIKLGFDALVACHVIWRMAVEGRSMSLIVFMRGDLLFCEDFSVLKTLLKRFKQITVEINITSGG